MIRKRQIYSILALTVGILLISQAYNCSSTNIAENIHDSIYTNENANGWNLEVIFKKGEKHNHPLMAIWTEDTSGNYLETLYIAESIGKGIFQHGDKTQGKWLPGAIRRPAALPVWAHKRNIQEKDGLYVPTPETPTPDGITGATPPGSFTLYTSTTLKDPDIFNLYFEINQTWDWNEHWTNNKFPDDSEYKTSCQPALVYRAIIDIKTNNTPLKLKLIGHSHYNGSDGKINTDLITISTAKDITKSISVRFKP